MVAPFEKPSKDPFELKSTKKEGNVTVKVYMPRQDVPHGENLPQHFANEPIGDNISEAQEPRMGTTAVMKKQQMDGKTYVWYNDKNGKWKMGYLIGGTKQIVPIGNMNEQDKQMLTQEGWQ
jgi:hypothetical protein